MNNVLPALLFLGSFAVPSGKRDYLENFHPGSRHDNTGIPANLGSVVVEG